LFNYIGYNITETFIMLLISSTSIQRYIHNTLFRNLYDDYLDRAVAHKKTGIY